MWHQRWVHMSYTPPRGAANCDSPNLCAPFSPGRPAITVVAHIVKPRAVASLQEWASGEMVHSATCCGKRYPTWQFCPSRTESSVLRSHLDQSFFTLADLLAFLMQERLELLSSLHILLHKLIV